MWSLKYVLVSTKNFFLAFSWMLTHFISLSPAFRRFRHTNSGIVGIPSTEMGTCHNNFNMVLLRYKYNAIISLSNFSCINTTQSISWTSKQTLLMGTKLFSMFLHLQHRTYPLIKITYIGWFMCKGLLAVTRSTKPHCEGQIPGNYNRSQYYCDVTMSPMTSQITGFSTVSSTVCSGTSKKTSTSLSFVRGIHRWPVDSSHKGPVTRKKVSIW